MLAAHNLACRRGGRMVFSGLDLALGAGQALVLTGPNGSGKSNVVDAVTWVMGAQGPRALRSAKMEDVIFAGTSMRPALGRAEVTLTIDNSSGKLPLDMAEVTISRILFRSGDSEYLINKALCRVKDIRELFWDTGIGTSSSRPSAKPRSRSLRSNSGVNVVVQSRLTRAGDL